MQYSGRDAALQHHDENIFRIVLGRPIALAVCFYRVRPNFTMRNTKDGLSLIRSHKTLSVTTAERSRSEALVKQMVSGPSLRVQRDKVLPHHDMGPRGRAPRLALVGDLDGRELNGMFVLSRLAAFLRGVEAGERRGLRLRERVVIVPTVGAWNRRGTGTRPIGRARAAHHRRSGEWAMTRAVMELTQAAYYRVDIHPISLDVEELPHLSLYAPNDDERASACLFGLPAVIERPAEDESTPDLVRAWRFHGGEEFVV